MATITIEDHVESVTDGIPVFDRSAAGITGADLVCELLKMHEVDVIFGYTGAAILPVFDALYRADIKVIVPRHEQGGGHMAEGYARASKQPGVCIVTSGPGGTNLVTALEDAFKDGTPLVVFVGQVPTTATGTDAFQEADIISITSTCTKWNTTISDVNDIPSKVNEAFRIAMSGRPGPVLVELPKDISSAVVQKSFVKRPSETQDTPLASGFSLGLQDDAQSDAIDRCAYLINNSRKPVIYAGQGILWSGGGTEVLQCLAEKAKIPVTTTLLGLGSFDESEPNSLGMLGMHGSAYANMAIQEADLVIAIGARFDERVTCNASQFAPAARAAMEKGCGGIIHFDIQPLDTYTVLPPVEIVEGDLTESLRALLPKVDKVADRPYWMGLIMPWRVESPSAQVGTDASNISARFVISRLSYMLDETMRPTIISTGVGNHQMWTARSFRWTKDRSLITSGGSGTMGFGLPAAIGAKVARPDALVIDIDGDASFNMTSQELATAGEFNIDVKVLLLNNNSQDMIAQLNIFNGDEKRPYAQQQNPDYVELARALNVSAQRVTDELNLSEKLKWLIEADGPALLEVMIVQEPVLPWVPPGCALHEMIHTQEEYEKNHQIERST